MNLLNSLPYIHSAIIFDTDQSFSGNLILDTEAAYTLSLITHSTVKAMKAIKKTIKHQIGTGLSGPIMGRKGLVELKLNNYLTHQVQTLFIKPNHYSMGGKIKPEKDGIIGSGFLKSFIVVFDYTNERFYLKPNIATQNSAVPW